jgi:hypothetical protein
MNVYERILLSLPVGQQKKVVYNGKKLGMYNFPTMKRLGMYNMPSKKRLGIYS